MARAPRNVILTGIPRSGTTLVTALIDSIPDAVALNEPYWQFEWMMQHETSNAATFARYLLEDFAATREKLLQGVPIPERRNPDGTAMTNYYRSDPQSPKADTDVPTIPFTRPGLTPNFTLAIKHNGPYLSCLRQIVEAGFTQAIAIVRHPAGVIASWNSMPVPQKKGKMPGAIMYWPQMRQLTDASMPLLEKQVRMYDLMCKRLYNLRDLVHVVKYEDVTENPNIIGNFLGQDVSAFSKHIKKRDVSFYNDVSPITEAIKKYGEFYRHFYPD
jgi:hypothetical protein